jgi:anti-sigma28 factor (negative regulator of flagellin synthesis)
MQVDQLSPIAKETIIEQIQADPEFQRIIDGFLDVVPERLANELIDFALARLRDNLDKIDTRKIAKAVIANEQLRGKIKVEIDDLGLGISARLQADIKEALSTESNLVRNLLTARREKKRAEMADLASKLSVDKQKREMASLKFQLAWMRFSKLTVALPTIAISFLLGVVAATNYFPAIGCEKGDPVCKVRVRDGLHWRK